MHGDWKATLRWQKLKLFCTDLTNLDLNCNDFFPMNGSMHTNSFLGTRAYIFLSMKTYRHFFTRAAEHMGISNLTSKRVKNVKESAVSDHLLQCNCAIDFDHFDVLASDTNRFRLLIKESLLIKRDRPVLNRTVKSFPLKLFD